MEFYAPQTPEARARRTRTGRVLAVALVLAGVAIVAPQAIATEEAGDPVAVNTYTVGAGETLWSIASTLTQAGEDVRDTIAHIQELNAMSGTALAAGAQIAVPLAG